MRILAWILGIGVIAAVGFGAGALAQTATSGSDEGDVVASADVAAVYDCPSGSQLDEYPVGSRVFAVAKTENGAWIQIRDLDAPGLRNWIPARALDGDTDLAALPVTVCDESNVVQVTTTTVASTTSTSDAGTTTTTTSGDTTTTSDGSTTTTEAGTTTTEATTTTTEAPDTTPPTLVQVGVSENKIWEEDTDGLTCGALPRESVVSGIAIDDESGIASVRASWTIEGTPGSVTMTPSGNLYSGTFGPFPYLTIPDNTDQIVDITVTARDGAGNQSIVQTAVRLHSTGTCFG